MKRDGDGLLFSPSDLVNFFRSEFITWMDRLVLEQPGSASPDQASEEDQLVFAKGLEHEREFLTGLKRGKKGVTDLSTAGADPLPTLRAMREGVEVIYQGYLRHENFAGYPDFLVRTEGPSELGEWSYEVWDTKLSRHPRPYFLIQLCCYAEMMEVIQGRRPPRVRVVLGKRAGDSKEIAEFPTRDYFYYYLSLKESFLAQQAGFDPGHPPDIPPLTDLGRWTGWAENELEARDDLSLVANIRKSQIRKLRDAGIGTVTGLAASKAKKIPELSQRTLDKLRTQARLQVESRGKPRPVFTLIEPQKDLGHLGLAGLPPASPGDILFDMEGYPLVDEGREYLFGASYYSRGKPQYRDWWAHSDAQEREALRGFIEWAYARWRKDSGMHIYHYNHYETDAIKRLMGKYGICEEPVDQMLRARVFVDLYPIVRQSVMIGEPGYSLKNVEKLYRPHREGDVASAGESMVFYQRWLIAQDGDTPETSAILRQIRDYNRDDCESTAGLAEWLRSLQLANGIVYRAAAVSAEAEPPRPVKADTAARAALAGEIAAQYQDQEGDEGRVGALLGHLLEFHRRAEKPIWWARYHRPALDEQELADDPDCLAGLLRSAKRGDLWTYRFDPHQESKLREGDTALLVQDFNQRVELKKLDLDTGVAVIVFKPELADPPLRLDLQPDELMTARLLAPAVERVVRRWHEGEGLPEALESFLYRKRPRLAGAKPGAPILKPGAGSVEGSIDAAHNMNSTALCVQGPPGTGKTYTAARMIAALLKDGKRIGITSNSHRAINLLLSESVQATGNAGVRFSAVKVGQNAHDLDGLPPGFPSARSGSGLFKKANLPALIGGTVFAFIPQAAAGRLDYLFVDEAGQVSMANLAAMAPSTRNIVLVGDQRQLSQPVQGSHPGESGLSSLDYLAGDVPTLPPDFGIFLPDTYRLHPSLCAFISDAVYAGRLSPVPGNELRILDPGRRPPAWLSRNAGLVFVPVDHEDRTTESPEEEVRIAELIADLLRMKLYTREGISRKITEADILVVTPYNLQVRRLQARLGNAQVGTVDKFQCQQAPVVIVSMCASAGDASPRGIDFLFSLNRLNVAISRAQTLAILVANPRLARTTCTSVEQMRLVNLFCRAVRTGRAAEVLYAGNTRVS